MQIHGEIVGLDFTGVAKNMCTNIQLKIDQNNEDTHAALICLNARYNNTDSKGIPAILEIPDRTDLFSDKTMMLLSGISIYTKNAGTHIDNIDKRIEYLEKQLQDSNVPKTKILVIYTSEANEEWGIVFMQYESKMRLCLRKYIRGNADRLIFSPLTDATIVEKTAASCYLERFVTMVHTELKRTQENIENGKSK